jgi:hypothetical protein
LLVGKQTSILELEYVKAKAFTLVSRILIVLTAHRSQEERMEILIRFC